MRFGEDKMALVPNIAVVDLCWDGDQMAPAKLGEDAGWTICDAVEDADKRTPLRPTLVAAFLGQAAARMARATCFGSTMGTKNFSG